jgi:ribosomal protein S18 acetylase RimI-like enzyme
VVEFRVVARGDETLLADLFEHIDTTFFRPHPFTAEAAASICARAGRDLHAVLVDSDGVAVAYGMLRGWDEGYATPSLGIAVRSGCWRGGLGRRMMRELHQVAAERGSAKVRLRVHEGNHGARLLYESLGYEYAGEDRGELVMVLPLRAAAAPGVRLFRPDQPEWDAALASARTSLFHSAGYHRYMAGFGFGTPYLAVVGDGAQGVAWPYVLRALDDEPEHRGSTATDVTSVYGYPGPVAWGYEPGDPAPAEALHRIAATWRQQGGVSAFTRFHPLLGNAAVAEALATGQEADDRDVADAVALGVVQVGWTVSVDLTIDEDAVRQRYARGLAKAINRARDAGLRTIVDEDWAQLPTFVEHYHADMARLGANQFYFFTADAFRRMRACLGERVHLLVTLLDDTVAAAGVFFDSGDHGEWHLVATNADLRDLSPAKVLLEDALRWGRERGYVAMHLGGGRGSREDSLYFFKTRFSHRRHAFHVGRWILDPVAYGELAAGRASRVAPGASLDPSYFPAYRAPEHDAASAEGEGDPAGDEAPRRAPPPDPEAPDA